MAPSLSSLHPQQPPVPTSAKLMSSTAWWACKPLAQAAMPALSTSGDVWHFDGFSPFRNGGGFSFRLRWAIIGTQLKKQLQENAVNPQVKKLED